MHARGIAKYWLALSGLTTWGLAANARVNEQAEWVVLLLLIMGGITVAGGLVHARREV